MKDLLSWFLSPEDAKEKNVEFFRKLAWEITTCDEASEMFPDMLMCPVCLCRPEVVDDTLLLVHKDPEEITN